MRSEVTSLLVGALVGVVFALFRAAPPAPGSFAGILGVVGIFLGWYITQHFRG